MGEVLNEYAAFIQALATVVLIAVTVGLARSSKETSKTTKLLANENRQLREDAKKPKMSAKLKPLAEHGDFLQLVLKNLGRGVAFNVRVRLDGDEEDFARHEMTPLRGASVPINFMSQEESEAYELGAGHTLFGEPPESPLKPFSVVIQCEDVDRKPYEERIVLDVRQFDGLAWSGASVAWRQMEALEEIAKHYIEHDPLKSN